MTLLAENQQTVEAALDVGRMAVTRYPSGYRADYFDAARAALRDLVAQADGLERLRKAAERVWVTHGHTAWCSHFENESCDCCAKELLDELAALARLERGSASRDGRTEGASLDGAR